MNGQSVQQLWGTVKTENRVNLVYLSEGYTTSELPKFLQDAQRSWNSLLSAEPFAEYRHFFNAFAVSVASNQSGSDHPSRGVLRDTYFDSTFESYGLDRALTVPPNDRIPDPSRGFGKAHVLLNQLLPGWNVIVILVNDPSYGGIGDKKGVVSSTHAYMPEIVAHELGHALGGLNDEYTDPFPGDPDPVVEEPNTTQETRRDRIKWRHWINPETPVPTPATVPYANVVGLFEGARFQATGWYRPKIFCKMSNIFLHFCEVCREAMVLAIYRIARPIESAEAGPLQTEQLASFDVEAMQPLHHSLLFRWSVNGIPIPAAEGNAITLQVGAWRRGTYEVTVKVSDPTEFVREDQGLLTESRTWVLTKTTGPEPQRRRP